jgi:hypothetical protein
MVAQKGAEMIAGYWERAAEAATKVAEASDRQMKATQSLLRMRRTDDQELAKLTKDQERLQKELADLNRPKMAKEFGMNGAFGVTERTVQLPQTDADRIRAAEIAAELQENAVEIEKLRMEVESKRAQEKQKNDDAEIKSAEQIAKQHEAAVEAQQRYVDGLKQQGDAIRTSLLTPAEEHRETMDELAKLYSYGAITLDTYTRAVTRAGNALDKSISDDVNERLSDFFGSMDQESEERINDLAKLSEKAKSMGEEMNEVWVTVSDRAGQAFADMLLSGENAFKSLADIVARSMLEIVARMAIINPILNGIFGGTSGWSVLPSLFRFGKPAAAGGYRDGSRPYLVGENGPELFNPGQAGTIIPNNKLGGGGGKGGGTYYIDARGADSAGMARLESLVAQLNGSIERRAVSAVASARQRGGALGRALA